MMIIGEEYEGSADLAALPLGIVEYGVFVDHGFGVGLGGAGVEEKSLSL